ncbi:unnamed protein product [Vicia faba]|uniref:Uncharacterized protein n=1 Tax=Vicia faba TaxID=3906 RepID=A0AAV0Z4A6_VICFA|nr:unnamed protein product [Vicia faba]
MKRYMLERGLLPGTEFRKAVGIEPPRTFDALLEKARAYMDYKERETANRARDPRNHGSSSSPRQDTAPPRRTGEKRRDDKPRDAREQRGPSGRFTEYTPLTTSRERILVECASTDFKDGGVKRPRPAPAKPGIDQSKYCQYHRSHGHLTEDCVHLKDTIETLIKGGRLAQYRRSDAPRRDARETREVEEDAQPSDESIPIQTVFSVTRLEDFYVPEHLQEPLSTHNRWENFPSAMVINGGGFNDLTINSAKRKLDELVDAAPP